MIRALPDLVKNILLAGVRERSKESELHNRTSDASTLMVSLNSRNWETNEKLLGSLENVSSQQHRAQHHCLGRVRAEHAAVLVNYVT